MSVQRRQLGRGGPALPVVGMGTWQTFDVGDAEVPARRAVVDALLEAGGAVVDSSPMYGRAERVLAATLRGRRDAAFVATKLWTADDTEAERQIDAALRWYDGRVDLYQVHNLLAWRTRLDQLERRRDLGQVRFVGVTHYAPRAFDEVCAVMRTGRVDAVQVPYNPRERAVERSVLPLAADLGVGVLVMRPFAEGALLRNPPPEHALEPLADYGVHTWAQALLAWVLADPRCTVAIPATTRPDRMRENAAVGAGPCLDDDARDYVAQLATGASQPRRPSD